MHVLNPSVELNTSGMGVNYYVAGSQILVPDYLKEFFLQPTRGPAQLSPVTEGEVEGWLFYVYFGMRAIFVVSLFFRDFARLCNIHTLAAQVVVLFNFQPMVVCFEYLTCVVYMFVDKLARLGRFLFW